MSLSVEKGILTILILSCLVSLGQGILCHSCQYSKCTDKYDIEKYAGNLGDCGDDMYCVKYKTIVWIRDSGEIKGNSRESSVVSRTCEAKKGRKEGCIGWQNNGGVTLKCWCGTDGCNSGRSIKPVSVSLLVVFVLGLLVTVFSIRH